jgi:hypothetical protein
MFSVAFGDSRPFENFCPSLQVFAQFNASQSERLKLVVQRKAVICCFNLLMPFLAV